MRCLLDKTTARCAAQGLLRLAEGQQVSGDELFALDLLFRAQAESLCLFVVPATANFLYRLLELPRYAGVIRLFLERVKVALPARYFRRWARRLHGLGFTREDAAVLALATFGTDENATILGMHVVATLDRPMIQHWTVQQTAIQERLTAMLGDIPAPYCHASLPRVLRPEQIVV